MKRPRDLADRSHDLRDLSKLKNDDFLRLLRCRFTFLFAIAPSRYEPRRARDRIGVRICTGI
jgi:hypothetical protein